MSLFHFSFFIFHRKIALQPINYEAEMLTAKMSKAKMLTAKLPRRTTELQYLPQGTNNKISNLVYLLI